MTRKSAPPFDVNKAKAMRAAGTSWRLIAKEFGVSQEKVQRKIDPGYAEHRNEQLRAKYRAETRAITNHYASGAQTSADAERLMDEIPRDTRDLTARLMGDPLPGRRSIDRKPQGAS
jgi:hypothetical protein